MGGPLIRRTAYMLDDSSWLQRAAMMACLSLAGCLFDSRYIQQKSAQKNVAQQQTPRQLQATPTEGEAGAAHARAKVLRLRVHATPSYAAEVVDWPRQFAR